MTTSRKAKRPTGRPRAADRRLSEILRTGATRKEAAALFGVTGGAIDAAVKAGAPRNSDGAYSVPALHAWFRERAATVAARRRPPEADEALTRWRTARAEREELASSREQGRLVRLDQVEERTVRQITVVRHSLNDMVRKMAQRLYESPSRDDLESELQAEVDHICESFAK